MDSLHNTRNTDGPIINPFIYTPLPDPSAGLRLLQLLPGDPDAPICCTLEMYEMKRCPAYHAVSYCWGDPTDPLVIYIDSNRLNVTRNCWFALKQIRSLKKGGTLWLDSICINQTDPAEKAAQVQSMSSIFQNADLVLACVGPDADDSQFLVRTLQLMPSLPSPSDPASMAPVTAPVQDDTIYRITKWLVSLDQDFGRFADALRAFSRRPFFTRLWIYQEMFLASKVTLVCGREMADMHTLTDIVNVCITLIAHRRPHEPPDVLETKSRLLGLLVEHKIEMFTSDTTLGTLPKMVGQLHREGRRSAMRDFSRGPREMIDVLSSVKPLQCQDPRDKVFGVVSVFGSTSRIVPNYALSSFELALQVLRGYTDRQHTTYSDHVQLSDLLCANLRLGLSTTEARIILAKQEAMIDVALEKPNSISMTGHHQPKMLPHRSGYGCRILGSESGHLTAAFVGPIVAKSSDLDSDVYKPIPSSAYKAIKVNQQTVAIVSIEALPGDWIVPLRHYVSDYYRSPCLGLVLRKRRESLYGIVGEVAFILKNEPCSSYETCECQFGPEFHPDQNTFFDLEFDCEELLLSTLRLQDTYDLMRKDAPTETVPSPRLPSGRTPLRNLSYATRHDSTEQRSNGSVAIERRRQRNLSITRK